MQLLRRVTRIARIEFLQVLIGALTVVAGLAWNNAFLDFFQQVPWLSRIGPFLYATALTALVCVLILAKKGFDSQLIE